MTEHTRTAEEIINAALEVKDRAKERRERWRVIGEALLIGRKLHKSDTQFRQWCKEKGFGDMPQKARTDSMWLAENWTAIHQRINPWHDHPTTIRRSIKEI